MQILFIKEKNYGEGYKWRIKNVKDVIMNIGVIDLKKHIIVEKDVIIKIMR